jgi:peptide/nickel transport system permease protein
MKRLEHILKKLFWAIATIAVVLVFNFFLFRVLPGDPATMNSKDSRLTADTVAALEKLYGLNKPVINCFQSLNPIKLGPCWMDPRETQFYVYLKNLFTGQMGVSFYSRKAVSSILSQRIINSLILITPSQIIAMIIGIIIGVIAAWKSHTVIDAGSLVVSLATWAMPSFWFGIMLLIIASRYGAPLGGMTSPGSSFLPLGARIADISKHLVVPIITYVIMTGGQYVMIMRSSLLNVLSEDYILTGIAKGLSDPQVLQRHALKNAMLPMVTMIATNLAFAVAGTIQIETVFSYPGIGSAIYESVSTRDFPVLQGAFLVIAIAVILANLLADLTYSFLDPRVSVD